jgi:hypothetical protein
MATDEGIFIDAGKINPIFQGTKPIYTGYFNEQVEKI